MTKTGQISVNYYFFGNQSKTDVKSIQLKKGKKKKTTFQNVEVTYTDFEVIKTIGRGAVGKILLIKYNNDEKYYAIKVI